MTCNLFIFFLFRTKETQKTTRF